MKIIIFSKYSRLGASSRLRLMQYEDFLVNNGFEIEFQELLSSKYIQSKYNGKSILLRVFNSYIKRFFFLIRLLLFKPKDTIIFIEKELFPYLPYSFEKILLHKWNTVILDYDDAVFHNYDLHKNWLVRKILSRKLDKLMKFASFSFCGNQYLKKRVMTAGAKGVYLPTVVDIKRYQHTQKSNQQESIIIGWIGTNSTVVYLKQIEDILYEIQRKYNIALHIIGPSNFKSNKLTYNLIPWSEETEVARLAELDIGIMPLDTSPWSQGKCGYKIIQYMALGIPVVSSSVGANCEIIDNYQNGILVSSPEQWCEALGYLIENPEKRLEFGKNAIQKVLHHYSLQAMAPVLLQNIKSVCVR